MCQALRDLTYPGVILFAGGNAVAQLIGVHPKDALTQEIDKVRSRPVHELPILRAEDLKVRVNAGGDWPNAVTSGIAAGVVFGLARQHLTGSLALMIPAAAIGLFIFNDNFRFTSTQKIFAIGLMIAVGLFWRRLPHVGLCKIA